MKKNILSFLFTIIAVSALLFGTGCNTTERLNPAGEYRSDAALFNADNAITGAYDVMDSFLLWEHENRAALAELPEITKFADNIRENGRRYIRSAIALREAYALNPTPENRDKLLTSISVLRAALSEATKYLAEHSNKR